jgi:hypothetical protein
MMVSSESVTAACVLAASAVWPLATDIAFLRVIPRLSSPLQEEADAADTEDGALDVFGLG